ncbi:MAG: terminase large subunit [Chloroflexi bacterium]|nr:terminase large subunit [Chloroflexota bacterium]
MPKRAPLRDIIRMIPGYDPYRDAGDCYFDEDAGQLPIDFFAESLVHVKGGMAGEPFILEDWQKAIVANLFGWMGPDGWRRYRESLIFVPRKNGKTTLIAGIVAYVFFCDGEPGAEIYSAAAKRDQALICFGIVQKMIEHNPTLKSLVKIYTALKSIEWSDTNSIYRALAAEADTEHGGNSHLVAFDEIHAQKNRKLHDVLKTSMASRDQPLFLSSTTSDFDHPSICNEKHAMACKVRDGEWPDIETAQRFLPVIYEASVEDKWEDPKVWALANPNLGVSVQLDYIREACKTAQEMPAYENTFKRLHLNVKTEQVSRWIQMARWDACGDDDPLGWRADALERLKGQSCVGGFDIGANSDLSALVLLFGNQFQGYDILPYFWCPKESAEIREKRDKVPYLTWLRQGYMLPCEGDTTVYATLRADINELADRYGVTTIAADRAFQGDQLIQELTNEDGIDIAPIGQGFYSMAAPTKNFERLMLECKLNHGSNPVLRWMASNVSVEHDAHENMKASKKASSEKIDGIVACIMAVAMANITEECTTSVYEERGVITLGG